MAATPTRVVCFSAYSQNLRARAVLEYLGQHGFAAQQPRSYGPAGSVWELGLTLIPYCLKALTCRADLVAGFKPHLNVTLPLLLCKLRGIPTWLDVDDLDHAYRDNWLSRILEFVERPFPCRSQMVSYHNDKLHDYLIGELHCRPEQVLQIAQGVDWQHFGAEVPQAARAAARQRYALDGRRVAIYVAHLNRATELEPVLHAWRQVIRHVPDGLLLVVGGGPRQKRYESMTHDLGLAGHVTFSGELPHAAVPACLAVADVAVLYFVPRRVNTYRCSLKLREYCAAGIKIVCNDAGELSRFAHLTYQSTSDVTDFAATLTRVLQGHGDGRERAARAFARTHLDWRHIVAGVAATLRLRLGPQ
jgi:glycosyltransferase involved in cell wall biosynthesis